MRKYFWTVMCNMMRLSLQYARSLSGALELVPRWSWGLLCEDLLGLRGAHAHSQELLSSCPQVVLRPATGSCTRIKNLLVCEDFCGARSWGVKCTKNYAKKKLGSEAPTLVPSGS